MMRSEEWNPTPDNKLPADYDRRLAEASALAETEVAPLTSLGADGFQPGDTEEFLDSVLYCASTEGVPISTELNEQIAYLEQFGWIERPEKILTI